MLDPKHPIALLLKEDRRYKFDAYVLVFEALNYAHKVMGLGAKQSVESEEEVEETSPKAEERHLTGQELCEAIRLYALDQYGFMAKSVLKSWGVTSTSDFGEIVFNLIRIGQMRKTKHDRREHFDNVYDFNDALSKDFKISLPDR